MLSEAEQAPGPVTPKGFSAPFRQFATLVLSEAEQLLARYASMQSACALPLVGPVWLLLRKSLAALALPRLNCSASAQLLLSFAEQEQEQEQAPSARVCSASAQLLLSFAEQEQEQEQEQGQQEFRSVTTPLLA